MDFILSYTRKSEENTLFLCNLTISYNSAPNLHYLLHNYKWISSWKALTININRHLN